MSVRSTCSTINLHTFPLHDVDIVFRAGIIAIWAQGSPEVGPQLAMSSDKGTNYFSVGKRETESHGNYVGADKSSPQLKDSQPMTLRAFDW